MILRYDFFDLIPMVYTSVYLLTACQIVKRKMTDYRAKLYSKTLVQPNYPSKLSDYWNVDLSGIGLSSIHCVYLYFTSILVAEYYTVSQKQKGKREDSVDRNLKKQWNDKYNETRFSELPKVSRPSAKVRHETF